MSQELPVFRFDLDPLSHGAFEKKQIVCGVCGQARDTVYTGNFYSRHDVENICPWCIADGSAAAKFEGEFHDCYMESDVSEEDEDKLMKRTPGHSSWQPQEWPVHCGSPCAFVAPVGMKEITELKADVSEDLVKQAESYGLDLDEFKETLVNEGGIQGYLYKCVKCGAYRLTTDCD